MENVLSQVGTNKLAFTRKRKQICIEDLFDLEGETLYGLL